MMKKIDDQEIYVSTGGKAFANSERTLTFIHGSGQNHLSWSQFTRHFAFRDYSVLAPDLPGHGLSSGQALDSIQQSSDWLINLLDTAGVEQSCLIGHSQGCLTAINTAARFPDRVKSIILIAGSARIEVAEPLLNAAKDDPASAFVMMLKWGYGPRGHAYYGQTPGTSMVLAGLRIMQQNPTDTLYRDLNACNHYLEGLMDVAALKCRLYIIAGDSDKMVPTKSLSQLIDAAVDYKMQVVDHCGHMIPQEQPKSCLTHLRSYIREIYE